MPTHIRERGSQPIDVRSFDVTVSQIREDHHIYYRASAEALGKTANAYGETPQAALTKLYEDVLPRTLGLERKSSPDTLFLPTSAFRGGALRTNARR